MMTSSEVQAILQCEVVVEEKIDGANVGFSVNEQGELEVQARGSFLAPRSCHPQFAPLFRWLERRRDELVQALSPNLILFGEWCYAVHSVRYTRLPDWLLVFDVYERGVQRFWSVPRRDKLARELGLTVVPKLAEGHLAVGDLKHLLRTAEWGDGPAEGLYVRRDEGPYLGARAKLVRPEFVQAIDTHWSRRTWERNRLAHDRVESGRRLGKGRRAASEAAAHDDVKVDRQD